MEWKALLIIVKEVDAVLDNKPYKGTLTPEERDEVKIGISEFAKVINSITSGNATMIFSDTIVLHKLTKISYVNINNGVWPDSKNIYDAIKLQGEKWEWGEYDSIFVAHPIDIGGGWGIYNPTADRGATYATINAKVNWRTTCNGEVFLHEWLHGSCGFFKELGYPMPNKMDTSVKPNVKKGDADCAEVLGYKKDTSECWKPYYIDLMTNKVIDKLDGNKPMGGVPLEAWKLGSLKNPQYYVGYSNRETGFDKDAFKNEFTNYTGVPKTDVRKYAYGFIQEFAGEDGDFAIMQGEGSNYETAYLVKPKVWKKFQEHGGVSALGYPTSNSYRRGAGAIQDFITNEGWETSIMNQDGSNEYFVVKGNCRKKFMDENGAEGYLGYPIGDEFLEYSDKYTMGLFYQKFQNGSVWVMSQWPWHWGANKNY